MARVHMTEAEVSKDFAGVLRKIGNDEGVVIGQNGQPIAVIKAAPKEPSTLSDLVELANKREKDRGYTITLDDDFAADVEQIVSERKPWIPGSWE